MSDPSATAKFPMFGHAGREKKDARAGALDSGWGEKSPDRLTRVIIELVPLRGLRRSLEKRENPQTNEDGAMLQKSYIAAGSVADTRGVIVASVQFNFIHHCNFVL